MTSDGSNPRTFGNVLGMLQLAAILLQFAGLIWLGGRWSAEMNATAERVRELQGIDPVAIAGALFILRDARRAALDAECIDLERF